MQSTNISKIQAKIPVFTANGLSANDRLILARGLRNLDRVQPARPAESGPTSFAAFQKLMNVVTAPALTRPSSYEAELKRLGERLGLTEKPGSSTWTSYVTECLHGNALANDDAN